MPTEQELCFGPYRVALEHGQVWRDQHEVKLTPKALSVLRVLILGAGHVVTKEELFQAIWPDTIVSDDALTTCILELRQTLRDNAKRPRFIETVHRRGYRFIAPLTAPPSAEESGARSQGSDSSSRPTPSPQSPTPAFVGREPELTQLHQWLEKALSGERQIVFVTGEAGIGKTALVDAFLQTLDARRQTRGAPPWFAYGQCIEHYGPGEPYLPILAALGRLCRTPEGKHLVTFLQHHAPTWLVHMPAVLEEMEVEALQRTTAGATRERMLRELAEAVEVLTADRPLLLWLEDLQWCDRSTLDWLSFLARRRERARLLVLSSYRPIDTIVHGHPLRLVKQDLHVHRQCEELPLRLLSEAVVAEYLAERFSIPERNRSALTRVARLVHRRTDGNPLFMVNVVDALITQGVITVGDDHCELRDDSAQAVATIPASLRQMIEHQVEQLTVEGRRVLEAASVAGMEFSAAAVAAGLAMTIDAAEEQCTTLVRRGQFIQATAPTEWPDGTAAAQYAFLHAFYQEVAYERIPTGRRQELHRRIGERKEAAYSRALTLNLVATLFVCCRDFQAVAQHAEAARVFAQECGFVHLMAMGMVLQGWAFVMQGKGEEGLALMQTGLTRQHAVGIGIGEVSYQLLLVEAYTRLGQREAALQTLATTFTAIESTGERTYEAEVYRLQGELKLQQESREHRAGNTEQRIRNQQQGRRSKEQKLVHTDLRFPTLASQNEAEACFYQAITIAQRQQAKSLELRASTSLARLWQQQGRKKEAHKMLSEIYHWFTEGFDTPDLQGAQAVLKELA